MMSQPVRQHVIHKISSSPAPSAVDPGRRRSYSERGTDTQVGGHGKEE
jgi:hypothetical protein